MAYKRKAQGNLVTIWFLDGKCREFDEQDTVILSDDGTVEVISSVAHEYFLPHGIKTVSFDKREV